MYHGVQHPSICRDDVQTKWPPTKKSLLVHLELQNMDRNETLIQETIQYVTECMTVRLD